MIFQILVALADFARRVASYNGVRFHIFSYHGAGAHYRAIANGDSRKDDGAIGNPNPVADDYFSATVRKIRRLRIMPQRKNGSLRPDGNVIASLDFEFPAVEQAVEINNISFSKMNLPAI